MKKIISFILVLAMLLTLIPMTALAEGEGGTKVIDKFYVSYDEADGAAVELAQAECDPILLKNINWGNMDENLYGFEKDKELQFILTTPVKNEAPTGKPYAIRILNGEWQPVATISADNIYGESSPYNVKYTPASDDLFILQVYWTKTQYDYDQFGPTNELPYLVEFHWNGNGNVTLSGNSYDQMTYYNNTKVRVASTVTALDFELHPDENSNIQSIRVEQEGSDNNDGSVDLEKDSRYNEQNRTFTIDLTDSRYNDEFSGKFVNINFDFSGSESEDNNDPKNNEYWAEYDNRNNAKIIIPGESAEDNYDLLNRWDENYKGPETFGKTNEVYDTISFTLVKPEEEDAPIVEVEVYDGNDSDPNTIVTLTSDNGLYSYRPAKDNGFVIRVWWTKAEYDYDHFGCGENEIIIEVNINGSDSATITSNDFPIAAEKKFNLGNKTKYILSDSVKSVDITITPGEGEHINDLYLGSRTLVRNGETPEYVIKEDNSVDYSWDVSDPGNRYFEAFIGGAGGDGGNGGNEENFVEVFFGNYSSINGNVVTYNVNSTDVTLTVGGAVIDVENHKVNVPRNDQGSVTFTVGQNFDSDSMKLHISAEKGFGADLALSEGTATLDGFNLPDCIDIEIIADGQQGQDPLPSWYTVSWAGGNVTVENGKVLATRVHVAGLMGESEIIYSVFEAEYAASETDRIYSLWDTIGKQKENPDDPDEPDSLQLYGLGFSQSDLFVRSDIEGVSIDFEFVPDYGYQLTSVFTNEYNILQQFLPDEKKACNYTFAVEKGANVHFQVSFEKTEDIISISQGSTISGVSISNGQNAAASGNLNLSVEDASTDSSVYNAVDSFDLTLDNIISKGGENGNWTQSVTEFDEPITLTMNLDKETFDSSKGQVYGVVREHNGEKELLESTYDASTGELIFETNKFSEYTIVEVVKNTVTLISGDDKGNTEIATLSGGGEYCANANVTIKAPAKSGYRFLGWYQEDTFVSSKLEYEFVMGNNDVAFEARYKCIGNVKLSVSTINGAEYTIGEDTAVQTGSSTEVPVGSVITIHAYNADKVFQWQNESGKVIGKGSTLTLTLTRDTIVKLVYKSAYTNQAYVEFLSNYGQVLSYSSVSSTGTVSFPTAPTELGKAFAYWYIYSDDDSSEIKEATEVSIHDAIKAGQTMITLKPYYTVDEASKNCKVDVYVDGAKNTSLCLTGQQLGDGITITAPVVADKNFKCWSTDENGTDVISYDSQLFIRISAVETTVYAIYTTETVSPVPVAIITNTYTRGTETVSVEVTYNVPSGYKLNEIGVIRTTEEMSDANFILGGENVKKSVSSLTSTSGVYTANYDVGANKDLNIRVRGYVIVLNDSTGNEEIYYSSVKQISYNSLAK